MTSKHKTSENSREKNPGFIQSGRQVLQVVSVFVAALTVADCIALIWAGGTGSRVTQSFSIFIARTVFDRFTHVDFTHRTWHWLESFHILEDPLSIAYFLALAWVANGVLVLAIAVFLYTGLHLVARLDDAHDRRERWFGVCGWFSLLAGTVAWIVLRMEQWSVQAGSPIGQAWLPLALMPVTVLLLLALRRHQTLWRITGITTAASVVLVSVVGMGSTFKSPNPPAANDLPDILLVSIDSLRADHLESYGYSRQTAPNLAQLANEGALFRNAFVPAPWTLASHLTMLSGLPPVKHGVHDNNTRLSSQATTLPEVLQTAGYQTSGFVSAPYLLGVWGYTQGFDWYDDYSALYAFDRGQHRYEPNSRVAIDALLRHLQASKADSRPRFMFLHLWDVHYDYLPPQADLEHFDPDYTGPLDGLDVGDPKTYTADMDPRDLQHVVARYDGEIRHTDRELERVFAALRNRGSFDNTIVIVTADHGEEFLDHGKFMHEQLYDELLHVPLLIRYPPAVPAGVQYDQIVRTMDISATVLGLTGVQAQSGPWTTHDAYAPLDISPVFNGRPIPDLSAMATWVNKPGKPAQRSIRNATHHYILDMSQSRGQLFDIVNDPREQHPIDDWQIAQPLHQELVEWYQSRATFAAPHQPTDAETEALKALGYIE